MEFFTVEAIIVGPGGLDLAAGSVSRIADSHRRSQLQVHAEIFGPPRAHHRSAQCDAICGWLQADDP